mgnify:CR=1 FL=1
MKIDISGTGINIEQHLDTVNDAYKNYDKLRSGKADNTGWVDLPFIFKKGFLDDIKRIANDIRSKCDLFIVIGIGGSYLGSKAVIEALNGNKEGFPEIIFAGFNMSAAYLKKIERRMTHEAVCLCTISKSGTTTEPLLTYHILKNKIIKKYGKEEGNERIYIITNSNDGILYREAIENGNKLLNIPNDVGGRYSVFTSVGLLPIAVAGHDIEKMLKGGAEIASSVEWKEKLLNYAICRVVLQKQGKTVEIFEHFEMNLEYFGEWLKQLFCESEGKEGKGAFATCLSFSRDLHSVGQFLQQGNQIFYETLICIKKKEYDFKIPESAGEPYAGKSLEDINTCAEEGIVLAHKNSGIPIIVVEVPELDEYNIGKLIYFFEISCAVSAYTIGVNPFDQPGVEVYKREMYKLVEELR